MRRSLRWVLLGTVAAVVVATGVGAAGGLTTLYQLMFKQTGTSAVARTARSKVADFVSVMDFGATGNGVTNDTVAVTAAIAYAGNFVNVYFPCPNTYLTTTWGTIPCGYESLVPSTGAVPRPLGTKIQEFLSAKDFGATGDGVTDDTSAIGNLLNAAASTQLINLPCPGTYVTSTYGTLACGVYYPPASATGATLRQVSAKLLDTVSVRDFGAKCDAVTDDGPALTNAILAANGSSTVLIPANCTLAIKSTVNVSVSSTTVRGMGFGSRIRVNFAGDVFNVTAALFRLEDVEINQVYTAATRATAALIVGASQYGTVKNIRIDGSASSANNGIVFKSTGHGTGGGVWRFDNIICCTDGTTWANFALISNSSVTETATVFAFSNMIIFGAFSDAGLAVDGTIDTATFTNVILGTAQANALGPALHIRNTVGGLAAFPRWIHCFDCYFEAPAQTIVKFDTGRDIQYRGYIATGVNGIAVGASAINVLIDGVHYANVDQSCVTIAAGSEGTTVINNHFDECGVQTTNTYDAVSVAANTNNFLIRGNVFDNRAANKPRYGINVAVGTSTGYAIDENLLHGTFGTGMINNQGSGVSQQLWNLPVQPSFNEHNASSIALLVPQFNISVNNNGSGFKHKRVAVGCTTAAAIGAACTSAALSWTSAFADASYTLVCTLTGPTGQPHISSVAQIAASFTVTIAADTAVAATATVDCIGVHD